MSAKHGLAGLFRNRGRLIGCCMTLALGAMGVMIAPAAASAEQTQYVALGDSISYGYSQERFNTHAPNEAPAFFEEGFDHWFTKDLAKPTEVGKGVVDVNMACPGETSGGFIGENEALGGKESTEPSVPPGEIQGEGDYHPCAYHFADGLPLHTDLSNGPSTPVSQLEEVLALLKEGNPNQPVKSITLNIGSNDELAAVATCKKEVTEEFTTPPYKSKYGVGNNPEESVTFCIIEAAETKTFPHILNDIGTILTAIDSTNPGGGHYTGAIVLMGFYNPDSFVLPESDALQQGLNQKVEELIVPNFPNVTYANPMPVFNKGATATAEQNSICHYTEMCNPNVQVPGGKPAGKDGDIHPTLAGYKALAKLANEAWLANPAK